MSLDTSQSWQDTAPSCDCVHTELRTRTRSNGVSCYVLQCICCGRELRAVKKSALEVRMLIEPPPPFDEALQRGWNDGVTQFYQDRAAARQQEWTDRQAAQEREREEREKDYQRQLEQRRRWYGDYLLSPVWRAKRALILKRANGICEGCLQRKATQVHHTTYAHIGEEFLFELVAICDECHTRMHSDKA